MNRINLLIINRRLTEKFGIRVYSAISEGTLEIRSEDLDKGSGFCIRVNLGWRNISAEFIPDNFAASLVRIMGLADDQQKTFFQSMYKSVVANVSELTMQVNSVNVDHTKPESWPIDWGRFHLRLSKMPIISEELTSSDLQELSITMAGMVLSLIIPLLPLEENEVDQEGLPEGAISRVEVNRYERSTLNRQACILINGLRCKVCGFDFEQFYGSIGRDFIHVHHVTPVSNLGAGYTINPAVDLVPICPNCHAMLHKRNPPFSIVELISIINESKITLTP